MLAFMTKQLGVAELKHPVQLQVSCCSAADSMHHVLMAQLSGYQCLLKLMSHSSAIFKRMLKRLCAGVRCAFLLRVQRAACRHT
jgi:hypothetical protein